MVSYKRPQLSYYWKFLKTCMCKIVRLSEKHNIQKCSSLKDILSMCMSTMTCSYWFGSLWWPEKNLTKICWNQIIGFPVQYNLHIMQSVNVSLRCIIWNNNHVFILILDRNNYILDCWQYIEHCKSQFKPIQAQSHRFPQLIICNVYIIFGHNQSISDRFVVPCFRIGWTALIDP